MAKSKVDIEQEYQDVLKVSTSLVGSLNQMIDDTAASQGRISDAAKKYNEQLKSIISNAAEEEELTEGVNKLLNERNSLAGRYFGANSRLLPQKQAELDVAISALKAEQSRIEVIGMVDNAAQELKSTLDSALDGILSGLNDIPVLGGLLSSIAKGPVEALKNSIGTAAQMFVTDFATGIRGGMKGMQALKMAGGNAFKFIGAAMNPVGIAIIAIGAALAVGIAGFVKLAAAASKFREETGLTNSQMGNMQNTIQNVYTNTASLGASMDEIAQAAADFTNEFHGIETPSEAVVTSMVALNKNFGIATGDAAKLNKVFQDMSGLTAEQAQHLLSSTVQMANMAGVAPSRVIKDLAENSQEISVYFRGSAKELAKAAVEAAALGTSMGDLSKQAGSLLDFETSIASEMKASALFGTHINLNKARAAAFDGDMLGMNKAIVEEVAKLGDLQSLNFAEKKALTELTGKDIGELQKQVEIYNKFGNLDAERLAAAQALMDTGKDISDLSEADLEAKNKELIAQREMQSSIDNVKNTFENMGNVLMTALAPLGEIFFGLLQMVGDLLMPAIKTIGNLLSMAFKPVAIIFRAIQAIIKPIVSAFSDIQSEVQPLFDKVNEVFVKIEPAITKIGSIIGGILSTVFKVIGSIVGVIVDIVSFLIDPIVEFISYLIDGFISLSDIIMEYIVEPIQSVIGGVGDFFSGVSSFFGGGDEETEKEQLEAAGSIEDGIVQNGKIVTTDPEDTLIATKTPGDLLGSLLENSPIGMLGSALGGLVGGGGVGDMTALLDEIRGLRADLNSGKIAVYMDGKNVTTKVASIASKSTKNNYK